MIKCYNARIGGYRFDVSSHNSYLGFPRSASGKQPACRCRRLRDLGFALSQENPLEEGRAAHSSIFAWKIP